VSDEPSEDAATPLGVDEFDDESPETELLSEDGWP
jgi:hypothetical protein